MVTANHQLTITNHYKIMSKTVIKAENISKQQYRLGMVGTGTIKDDMKRWWHNVRGKEDPFLKIGEANNRAVKGESDYVWSLAATLISK